MKGLISCGYEKSNKNGKWLKKQVAKRNDQLLRFALSRNLVFPVDVVAEGLPVGTEHETVGAREALRLHVACLHVTLHVELFPYSPRGGFLSFEHTIISVFKVSGSNFAHSAN